MAEKRKSDPRDRVVRELGRIAYADMESVKPSEKLKALELLGKHLGMWKEREPAAPLEGELSKLSELLEQRRARREETGP